MQKILRIANVQKFYGTSKNIVKAINNISFEVSQGEFVGIMGASGSGKTTLLNCISTIDTVSAGHIYVKDDDITEIKSRKLAKFRRENLGFIFQDYNLLDNLTVFENIAMALTINKVPTREYKKRIYELSSKLGINNILNKYPYEISGGQKQRCACVRALINHPKIVLADEPTGALDSNSSSMLLKTMEKMNVELKSTILMVTHDAFSASYAERILFLKDGKIFTEINKGNKETKEFFNDILQVMAVLGGSDNV